VAGLVGRALELELIRGFIDRAEAGGAALVLLGEPGVGKTAVLDAGREMAAIAGFRVLRASGVQFEVDVTYSGLNQILLPLYPSIAGLPPAQRDALNVALGFGDGPAPERLIVANATLTLLREATVEQPLLIALDDLPWLDRASAGVLGLVARRLEGSPLGLLAAARTGDASIFESVGLPEHELQPLDEIAADSLIEVHHPALAPGVRRRLLAEACGNPLALIELPAALSEPQRSAAGALPPVLPLNRRLHAVFASSVSSLSPGARRLLLLAALDGSGDLRVVQASSGAPGGIDDLAASEQARLVYVDQTTHRLMFRHPLIRAAVVELSTHDERRRAHAALAGVFADQPDRHVWHLAEATVEPEERVASLLEESGHRVLRRGDATGAVAALIRSADLSPSGTDRGRRLAEAAYIGAEGTGELAGASVLLADAHRADPNLGGSVVAAAAAVFLLLNNDGDVTTAHRLLVGAIETGTHRWDASEVGLIEALYSLLLVCWYGGRAELWEPFYAALERLEPGPPALLDLYSKTFADPARTAAGALDVFDALAARLPEETDPTFIMRFASASVYLDRLAVSREGSWRIVRDGRRGGPAPARRQLGSLMHLCMEDYVTGRWEEEQQLADEGLEVCAATGYGFFEWYFLYHEALLAAGRGEFDASRDFADRMSAWALPRGVLTADLWTGHPRALAALGEGDFEEAFRQASAVSPAGVLAPYVPQALWVPLDLVESAMRTGRQAEAAAHVDALREANIAAISSRMALVQAGAGAIAAVDDHEAFALFDQAIAGPDADHWAWEAARVRLAYGERLRRARALTESRVHLTAALEAFEHIGARPWAVRAGNELRATGPTKPRADDFAARDALTPQEREIAQLAAAGLSNKQIGERLFLSHRTVGNHLHRIFPKLGVTSRAALRDALQARDD
jgi:DNA-binding CsgD family transcriptional regulator